MDLQLGGDVVARRRRHDALFECGCNRDHFQGRTGLIDICDGAVAENDGLSAIQDELAVAIARAMEVMLTDQEKEAIEKSQTADIQAYDFYLRGRQYFHRFRRQGFDFARQMFARATVIDPEYARAYAGVAYCCSFMYMYYESTEANLKEAEAASRKALELDPTNAQAKPNART